MMSCFQPFAQLALAWSILAIACPGAARADAVVFAGSTIAMRGCTIEGIRGDQVHFSDPAGRRQQRPIAQIQALSFEGLEVLDRAEALFASGDAEAGLPRLMISLADARNDVERLWIRIRLVRAHRERGELVQAIGHAAAAISGSDDAALASLVPTGPLNQAPGAAVHEATSNLHEARRRTHHPQLRGALERMALALKDAAATPSKSPASAPQTISGIAVEELRAIADGLPGNSATVHAIGAPSASRPAEPNVASPGPATVAEAPASPPETASTDPGSPQEIALLLERGRDAEALSRCRAVAQRPGDRDLAQFLHQYGMALARSGHAKDAAVMFTRCATMYPATEHACHSLAETAIICRDIMHQPDNARRLLEVARQRAREYAHSGVLMLIDELAASLEKATP